MCLKPILKFLFLNSQANIRFALFLNSSISTKSEVLLTFLCLKNLLIQQSLFPTPQTITLGFFCHNFHVSSECLSDVKPTPHSMVDHAMVSSQKINVFETVTVDYFYWDDKILKIWRSIFASFKRYNYT